MDLIVNVSSDWGIGCGNRLLYSIPDDLKRFRRLTLGRVVILGRKTLETFPGGRPLAKRTNIILTTDREFTAEGAVVVHDLQQLEKELQQYDSRDISVIGGESVYRQLLPLCDTAHVTKTYGSAKADRFVPDLDKDPRWRQTDISEEFEYEGLRYRYITYKRVK